MRCSISATCGSLSRRSMWTPKMFMPARANSMAVASPKPLDAPRIRAQGCLFMVVCSGDFRDFDFPFVVSDGPDADFRALRGHELREPLAPLHQHHGVLVENLVQPQGGHLARFVQPVQVNMVHPPLASV